MNGSGFGNTVNERQKVKMTAIKSSISFDIITKYHKFKSWSQLAEEAKGGYLEGFVQIAPEVTKVELALYNKDDNSIPCLLFVTPNKKGMKVSTCFLNCPSCHKLSPTLNIKLSLRLFLKVSMKLSLKLSLNTQTRNLKILSAKSSSFP